MMASGRWRVLSMNDVVCIFAAITDNVGLSELGRQR